MKLIKFYNIAIFILFSIINTASAKEKVDNFSVYAKFPIIGEVEVQKIETKLSILECFRVFILCYAHKSC